jgi:hypothetical protein
MTTVTIKTPEPRPVDPAPRMNYPFKEYIWDQIAEGRGLTVTGVADDGITASYRISFEINLDKEARAAANSIVATNGRTIASVISRAAKLGLRVFFGGEK